ncbi:MAG: PEP-CTERM sorting domain-containing protein [Planctomycetes bacterium]|nr:PEP-CTERM sorting domain-containing protein [Planctomycetota bacterium]
MKIAMLALAGLAAVANADVITQWTFNSNPADANTATGTLTPATGSGTAATLAGNTQVFNSGNTNDTSSPGDNSRWSVTTFAAQGTGSGARGVTYNVSTAGYTGISVNYWHRFSNTSNRFSQVEYTLDGSTYAVFTSFENTSGGDAWNNYNVDFSSVAGANNNASFGVRITSIFGGAGSYVASNSTSNYATTGTWGFDLVTFNGTLVPTPGSVALMGLGGLLAARRRR